MLFKNLTFSGMMPSGATEGYISTLGKKVQQAQHKAAIAQEQLQAAKEKIVSTARVNQKGLPEKGFIEAIKM